MKKNMKKVLSLVLALVLAMGMMSIAAMAEDTTVYCDASAVNWTTVNVYCWNDAGQKAAWPGEAMTQNAEGLWVFDVPAEYNNIIFNDGSTQTIDLTRDANLFTVGAEPVDGSKLGGTWSDKSSGEVVAPETPEVPTELVVDKMVAVGNGSDAWLNGAEWDTNAEANVMTEISDNVYQIVLSNVAAGDAYELKFAANGAWTDNFGLPEGVGFVPGEACAAVYNAQNIKIQVTEACDVTVTLDLTGYNHGTKEGAKLTIAGANVVSPNPAAEDTGDASNMVLWSVVMVLACVAMAGAVIKRRSFN